MFLFLLEKDPGVQFPGSMIQRKQLFFFFKEISKLFLRVTCHITFPLAIYEKTSFAIPLSTVGIVITFSFSHSD